MVDDDAQRAFVERLAEQRVENERLAAAKTTRRRRLGLAAIGIVGGVAILIAASVALSVWRHHQATRRLAAQVDPLKRFVELQRGHRFTAPVRVRLLGTPTFNVFVEPFASDLAKQYSAYYPALLPLGLLPDHFDPFQAALPNFDRVVGVYYHGVVTVEGTRWTPYLREVVIHELTHALDDQVFDFARVDQTGDCGGGCWSVNALIEGDAIVVQQAYEASLVPADERQAHDAMAANLAGLAGQALTTRAIFTFPYDYGPAFIRTLIAAGGQGAVDEAFRSPPTYQSEVMGPDAAATTSSRDANRIVLDESVPPAIADSSAVRLKSKPFFLGEKLLGLVLQQAVSPVQAATLASTTNDGGIWITWNDGQRQCIEGYVDLKFGKPDSARQGLLSVLVTWAAAQPDGSARILSQSVPVIVVTSCR